MRRWLLYTFVFLSFQQGQSLQLRPLPKRESAAYPPRTCQRHGLNDAFFATSLASASTPTSALDLEYYNPNEIQPETRTVPSSMIHFAKFIVQSLLQSQRVRYYRRIRRKLDMASRRPSLLQGLRKLNEQRRNIVQLADYTARIVAPSFFSLTVGALLVSMQPHFVARCIHVVATLTASRQELLRAVIGLLITSTAAAAFTGLRGSLFWIGGSRANYNIRVKLHRNLLLQEAAFFDSNEVGYLLSRLNSDVNKIGQVISYHVNVVCRQLAQFIFGSVILLRISPRLSLYAFSGILAIAVVSAVYGSFNRSLAQRVQDTVADATAVSETSFRMSETIRAFDGVEIQSDNYCAAQSRALDLEEIQAWGYGTHKFVSDTLQSVLDAVLLLACWRAGRAGNLSAVKLTTFMFYTNFVLESSNEVGDQWAKIQGAVGASSSVFDLIRRVPAVRDPPRRIGGNAKRLDSSDPIRPGKKLTAPQPTSNGISQSLAVPPAKSNGISKQSLSPIPPSQEVRRILLPAPLNGASSPSPIIRMSNVTLQYDNMECPALRNVNLEINDGDRVAVVGRSGSGKSSLLRTIMRFYDPTSGDVALSGRSLTSMARNEIAQQLSVVQQEPALFPMSLMENVLYGIPKDASIDGVPCYSKIWRAKVVEALTAAGFPLNQTAMSISLDTRIGEGGRALSGGQRQRVAIARALIREPTVLLLDEPTSALDSQSEQAVVTALLRALERSKCMAMVTHRLGVLFSLGVNRVIVMEKGEIVEVGHPEELLRDRTSMLARLAEEQGITYASRRKAGKSN